MGYRFSLVLSREITENESVTLQEEGCSGAAFSTDSLPTNAEVTVTRLDFDDMISPSLAEAIESALAMVQKMPDLSVPGLEVPAQPTGPSDADGEAVTAEVEDITDAADADDPAAGSD